MRKINENHSSEKKNRDIIKETKRHLDEDIKRSALKLKEETARLRIERKEFAKKWKEDAPKIKQFNKEIKAKEKEYHKNGAKEQVKKVREEFKQTKKTRSDKKRLKYKLERAKNYQYDYSKDIIFEDVSYTYSRKTAYEFKALNGTNLTIKEGIITAIIGTTGSGKSTLIQLANGLLITDTGRSIIGDFQIPARTKKIRQIKPLRKEVGLVFQFPEYQLFQETIEKDIAYGPINMGGLASDEIAKVPELLKLVDLPEDYAKRSPFALSGGQKRRVAIAGIIAMDGNTLVLDEPTGGLDPKGEEDFMNLFHKLNKEKNKRIIIVTHNMDHVLQIADEVIVMSEGKVIRKGSPFEIFKDSELLRQIEIEPPKIYKLAHVLKTKGIDVTDSEFRTIEEFSEAVLKAKKAK